MKPLPLQVEAILWNIQTAAIDALRAGATKKQAEIAVSGMLLDARRLCTSQQWKMFRNKAQIGKGRMGYILYRAHKAEEKAEKAVYKVVSTPHGFWVHQRQRPVAGPFQTHQAAWVWIDQQD